MYGLLAEGTVIGIADVIELFLSALEALIPGLASVLVSGFSSFVTDSTGGFSLLAVWAVVLVMFSFGVKLTFGLLNKITNR